MCWIGDGFCESVSTQLCFFFPLFFCVCESWETSSACRSHSPSRRHIIYQEGWRGRENDVNNESQQIPSGHQRKHKSTQTSRKVLTLVFHFNVDSKRNQTKVRRKSLKQTLVTRSPVLIQVRLWVNNIRRGASTWAPTFLPSASSNLLRWSCRHTHTKHQKPQTFVWAFLSAFFGWGAAQQQEEFLVCELELAPFHTLWRLMLFHFYVFRVLLGSSLLQPISPLVSEDSNFSFSASVELMLLLLYSTHSFSSCVHCGLRYVTSTSSYRIKHTLSYPIKRNSSAAAACCRC